MQRVAARSDVLLRQIRVSATLQEQLDDFDMPFDHRRMQRMPARRDAFFRQIRVRTSRQQ